MRKKIGRVGATFHGRPRLYARKIIYGTTLGLILIFTLGKLAMAEVWQKIVTSGTPPDKRNGHVLISPGSNQQFIFGGFGQNNDLWILREEGESSRWEYKVAKGTAPSARGGHSGIFVPEDGAVVEDSIIIFGGSQSFEGTPIDSGTYKLEDPWSWDPIWEELATGGTAPSPRAEHTAVYEQGSNKMVVFGGYTIGIVVSSETYTLDFTAPTAQWTKETTSGEIPARYGHSAVWSDWQMIVFGGKDGSGELLNDCWRLEGSSWIKINVTGDKPPARWQHTAVWIQGDPMTMEPGGMLIFGGEDENENPLDDVWVLQQPFGEPNWKWEKLYPIGDLPSARAGHAAASGWGWGWDGEEKMFIFGGSDGNNNLNDIYAFARAEEVKKTLQEKPFNAPNPFNPDTEETKICYYLDEDDDVKIKLFTLTGELVYSWENISGREGLNQWPWNGKNEKGRIVENGGYICLIEAGGKKQKCKIAVLR
jgi:hypothetical protein